MRAGTSAARLPVAHARLAHRHGPDAGHDLALGQMPVPHDSPAAVVGLQIGGRGQKLGHFRFDRLGQKRPRAIAQNLGQPVGQNPWLNQFDNGIVGHGISLLRWRSGGSNTPTICRLPQFTPSPTFGHSSAAVGLILTAIERDTEPDDLRNLARALQAMPVKLTDQQAQAVVGSIIAAIQQETADLSSLEQVWGILEGLPAKLVDGQSQEDLSPFLDLIKSNGSDEIKALAQALQAVPAKLTDAQAQAVIAPLLAAMNPTANPFALLVLAQGLQAMPVKVAGTQAQASVSIS